MRAFQPTRTPDRATCTDAYVSRFSGTIGEWLLSVQKRTVLEMLDDVPPGGTVVDVGGGHAQLAPHLAERGFRVVVVGTAPECRRLLGAEPSTRSTDFVVGSFHRLPFADGQADAVVTVRTLAHIAGWRKFVHELCRITRGPVVTDFPTVRSVNSVAGPLYSLKNRVEDDTTRPFRTLGRSEVRDAFRNAGFRITRCRAQFLWPMALHRALGRPWLARGLEAPFRALGVTDRFGSPAVVRADLDRPKGMPRPLE